MPSYKQQKLGSYITTYNHSGYTVINKNDNTVLQPHITLISLLLLRGHFLNGHHDVVVVTTP